MCGLVGMVGDIGVNEEKVFKQLLYMDALRGPHSTGVVAVPKGKDYNWFKSAETAADYLKQKDFNAMLNPKNVALLGHNRWATTGAINAKNAHPFDIGNIVGMHNGTLRGQHLLDDHRDFEVDSENIFHHMNKNGVSDTIAKLKGAFALVWHNKEEDSINLVRNGERSLHIALTDSGRTFFWASEEHMLHAALKRNRIYSYKHESLKVGQHIKIILDKDVVIKPLAKFIVKDLELYKEPYADDYGYGPFTGYGRQNSKKPLALPSGKDYSTEKALVGKTLPFVVKSSNTVWQKGVPNSWFRCEIINNEKTSCRVYANKTEDLGKLLLGSDSVFMGKVKKFNDNQGYLLLDKRSVVECEEGDLGEDDNVIIGSPPTIVDKCEYYDATGTGCGVCGLIPMLHEWDNLWWSDDKNFLCESCADWSKDDEALNFLS